MSCFEVEVDGIVYVQVMDPLKASYEVADYRQAAINLAMTTMRSEVGKLTLDDFRQAFFDDYATPYSVCRPPRPNNRGAMVATSAMILMRPGEGHLEACPMPALNRRFTTYTLTPDRLAQKQASQKQAAE